MFSLILFNFRVLLSPCNISEPLTQPRNHPRVGDWLAAGTSVVVVVSYHLGLFLRSDALASHRSKLIQFMSERQTRDS